MICEIQVAFCFGFVFVSVCGLPRNVTTRNITVPTTKSYSVRYRKNLSQFSLNDNDSTPSEPKITSSHLDVKEYSYSDIFRTLPPTNSSEEIKKKRRKKKKQKNKKNSLGFWTKAGTAVASLVNGYNTIRNTFGNNNRIFSQNEDGSDDEYEDSDYDESDNSESKHRKPTKKAKEIKGTTVSFVEQAYKRAMTFTPRYKWDDDKTTERPTPSPTIEDDSKESDTESREGRNYSNNKVNRGEEKSATGRKYKIENKRRRVEMENQNRKKEIPGKFMSKKNIEYSSKNKNRRQLVPSRRRRRKEVAPWPSSSYIKPILSTTSKVLRGLDTLAFYGSYASYTLLPVAVGAIRTVQSLLPAPETVAKIESSPPFAVL